MVELRKIKVDDKEFEAYGEDGKYVVVIKGERKYFKKDAAGKALEVTSDENPTPITGGYELPRDLLTKIDKALAHKAVTLDDLTVEETKPVEEKYEISYTGFEVKDNLLFIKARYERTEENFAYTVGGLGDLIAYKLDQDGAIKINESKPIVDVIEKITPEQKTYLSDLYQKAETEAFTAKKK